MTFDKRINLPFSPLTPVLIQRIDTMKRLVYSVGVLYCGIVSTLAANALNLGTAASFAVFGSSGLSNMDGTVLNGDLGDYPSGAASITGFPPGIVLGTIHAGDPTAHAATMDASNAYIAGRGLSAIPTDVELGGITFPPGVYAIPASALMTVRLTLCL